MHFYLRWNTSNTVIYSIDVEPNIYTGAFVSTYKNDDLLHTIYGTVMSWKQNNNNKTWRFKYTLCTKYYTLKKAQKR